MEVLRLGRWGAGCCGGRGDVETLGALLVGVGAGAIPEARVTLHGDVRTCIRSKHSLIHHAFC